jgi:hypothetical protein
VPYELAAKHPRDGGAVAGHDGESQVRAKRLREPAHHRPPLSVWLAQHQRGYAAHRPGVIVFDQEQLRAVSEHPAQLPGVAPVQAGAGY